MLIAVIALFFISLLAIIIFRAWKRSTFLFVAEIGMVVILLVFYINGVKNVGFSAEQQTVLFGFRSLVAAAKSLYIPANELATVLVVARLMTALAILYDALQNALGFRRFLKKHFIGWILIALPIIAACAVSMPQVFFNNFAYKRELQDFVVAAVDVLILLYVLAAAAINLYEQTQIGLSWYKRQNSYRLVTALALILQFIFVCTFNPVTIFQDYSRVFVSLPYLRYINIYALPRWITIFSMGLVLMIMSAIGSILYARYSYDRESKEVSISRAIDSATIATSGMVHGIKNQLLAAKVLSLDIADAIEEGDKQKGEELAGELVSLNEQMLGRVNMMYKAFKSIKIVLGVVETEALFDAVKEKLKSHHVPDGVVTYESDVKYAFADVELLSEAIVNVVTNAYEAMPNVGRAKIEVRAYTTRMHMVFAIKDNGVGIPKEMQAKIFEPFVTTKNSTNNWGLGLCYARQIVKNHLGDVTFETKQGKGTTFYLTLPKYDEKKNERVKE